ncbi:MAG: hypothetical protein LAT82_04575 [Nanoarchaeota archaeon]|nr:hypothetical protein [Nanoarchaeota archaeon]
MSSILFTTSGIKYCEIFGMLFPMSSFLLIIQELEKNENNINNINFKKISFQTSKIISLSITSNINSKEKINKILNIINQFGFGKLEVKILSKNKIIISHKKYICKIFEQVYKLTSSKICEKIISNILYNCLEEILRIKISNLKISENNTHLFYTFKEIISVQKKNEKVNLIQKNNIDYAQIENPIIAKIKHEKQLIIKNGILSLWKTSGVFIPFEILDNLFNIITQKNSKTLEIIAQLQLYSAVELQRNVFGVKDNDKIFQTLLLQTSLIGIGETKIILKNKSKIVLKLRTQIFENLDFNKNKNLENFCIFILKGIIEFGLDIKTNFEKNSITNKYVFNIIYLKRELSREEIEFTKFLSANIQINKFI